MPPNYQRVKNTQIMKLWTYQHPAVLKRLLAGKRYVVPKRAYPPNHWQNAYVWVREKMNKQGIAVGANNPIWAWHSVGRLYGKPDADCANALLSGMELERGVVTLELQVPDDLALLSHYGEWNELMHALFDQTAYDPELEDACFAVDLAPRRGRPSRSFNDIQACLPFIEPEWLIDWEVLDLEAMMLESHHQTIEYIAAQRLSGKMSADSLAGLARLEEWSNKNVGHIRRVKRRNVFLQKYFSKNSKPSNQ